jgi:leucyl/phenylalanyl-tRNA---protein transferase
MKGEAVRFPVLLDPWAAECEFPDVSRALLEPNGLLAIGGNLEPECLLRAYRRGIFPWYEAGQPILWWSPDPRLVLFPSRLRVSRSLRRGLRQQRYAVTFDEAFEAVIQGCSEPRDAEFPGTWITPEMMAAYIRLHRLGHAHSAEAWRDGELVGGVYGVSIGRVFFGESMFHRARDASKHAFVRLVEQLGAWDCAVIDCQMQTSHLLSFGAEPLAREDFVGLLAHCDEPGFPASWREGV